MTIASLDAESDSRAFSQEETASATCQPGLTTRLIPGPKLSGTIRGHVARSIASGKRPYLTATVSAETFRAIDRYCLDTGVSRGVAIDRAIDALLTQTCEKSSG